MAAKAQLSWKKRCLKGQDTCATWSRWETKDGAYRVVHRVSLFKLKPYYAAMVRWEQPWSGHGFENIGDGKHYKTKERAMAACEKHARENALKQEKQ